MEKLNFLKHLPSTLTPEEVADFLGISKEVAYRLLNTEGFPSFTDEEVLMVTKYSFIKWIEENAGL